MEDLPNFFKTCHQLVNIFVGIVEGQRGPCCRRKIQTLHHRHGTVMTSPDRDPLQIQDRPNVMGMDVIQHKRDHTGLFFGRSHQGESWNMLQILGRVLQELLFVLSNRLKVERMKLIEGRT